MVDSKLALLVTICCIFNSGIVNASSDWSYTGDSGPDHWSSLSADCKGTRQSPINIESNAAFPDPTLSALQFLGYEQNLDGAQLINNGHTVQVNLPSDKTFTLLDVNGNNYTALQVHFHWIHKKTSEDGENAGSEHTVNGQHYDAEMHIVHIKQGYSSAADVAHMVDGLGVIGVFLKAQPGAQPNDQFQALFNAARDVTFKDTTSDWNTEDVTLKGLLPKSGSYYRYFGSLTTPPCTQDVVWTVYQTPQILSSRQMAYLQSLTVADEPVGDASEENDEDLLGDNFRPTQPLNGRIVSSYNDFALQAANKHGDHHGWSYKKGAPEHWGEAEAECSATHQSPINFDPQSIEGGSDLEAIDLSDSYDDAVNGKLLNNGHTIKFSIESETDRTFTESSHGDYKALQVHFHWGTGHVNGKDVSVAGGSEHTVNNNHFPIEMHIVHAKLNDEDEALNNDDFAVLGTFFSISNNANDVDQEADEALKTLTQHFHKIQFKDQQADVAAGPVLEHLMPSVKSYYRYMGSLTTPPCTEAVLWTVWTNPVTISTETFLAFQSIFMMVEEEVNQLESTNAASTKEAASPSEYVVSGNFRPVQKLNGRTVLIYDETPTASESSTMMIIMYACIGLVALAVILAAVVFLSRKKSSDESGSALYQKGSEVNA